MQGFSWKFLSTGGVPKLDSSPRAGSASSRKLFAAAPGATLVTGAYSEYSPEVTYGIHGALWCLFCAAFPIRLLIATSQCRGKGVGWGGGHGFGQGTIECERTLLFDWSC